MFVAEIFIKKKQKKKTCIMEILNQPVKDGEIWQ